MTTSISLSSWFMMPRTSRLFTSSSTTARSVKMGSARQFHLVFVEMPQLKNPAPKTGYGTSNHHQNLLASPRTFATVAFVAMAVLFAFEFWMVFAVPAVFPFSIVATSVPAVCKLAASVVTVVFIKGSAVLKTVLFKFSTRRRVCTLRHSRYTKRQSTQNGHRNKDLLHV